MNADLAKLIRVLADGRYYSAGQLGATLGVSGAAVGEWLQQLDALQLDVEAESGTGYRLRGGVDLYAEQQLTDAFRERTGVTASLEIVDSTGSTNSDLLARASEATRTPQFLFAEHQHAGRGRQGRAWVTPYAGSIAFSLLRRFECGPAELGALSLVAGLSLVETLSDYGVPRLGLKWPNDLVHRGLNGELRKLGGILVEIRSESEGPCAVVIGVGINYAVSGRAAAIAQPWTDLRTLLDVSSRDRSRLAGELAAAVATACDDVESRRSTAYLARWAKYDVLSGEQINVQRGSESFAAVADGIDERGALLVKVDGARFALQSGEVSVRKRS